MARLSQGPVQGSTAPASSDVAVAELTQLLLRLQHNLLHPSPDRERRLRTSEYERAKVEANLEYARAVLTKLEQDALHVKAPTRRMETQNLLNVNRERLETLLDRLEDLRHMAVDDDNSSEEEDLLGHIIPTPSESMDSRSSDTRDDSQILETPPAPPTPEPIPTQEPVPPPASTIPTVTPTQTTQTLRSRPSVQPTPSPQASSSHTTARAALFANRQKPSEPETTTATAEAIIENQKAEQDDLTNSILEIASALKESSKRFASTLEEDMVTLQKTDAGMSKAEQSMESASGRMGTLRKMTEGKGWWGRMILYAWVYGLMVGLILLVFVMPKLRF
ncbi:synaptobrevin [Pochonia chlamydosporia 170]|uniref:Synaptobrevin n=1 Tax=Pochonia chlamydosporia 170 TaxID=1380566 RepID=A0A179FS45_METCM|nr:synaptobrevin [Pochonia chlamydosporia 170]OAQ68078.1 synaptobrevin [Pochonia chlamydosporia 170]